MTGYVRQSAADIVTDNVILAAPLNDEFNALVAAFNGTTGHTHDGSTGNGPKISLTSSVSGILPVLSGGTGVTTLAALKTALNLNPGTDVQAYDADLTAIAALTGTGISVRTADNVWALRTLTGTANELTVTNGNGATGNPVVSLPAALTFTGKTITGGTFTGGTFSGTTVTASGAIVGGTFSGVGTALTALNATQLTSGTVPVARISGSYTGITGVGALNSGNITSGFGNIDIGTANVTANIATFVSAWATSSGNGSSSIRSGTSVKTGFVEGRFQDDTRGWYIGDAAVGGRVSMAVQNGVTGWDMGTGSLNVGAVTPDSVISGGNISGALRHRVGGNYMYVGSYNSGYGDGSARVWWNENDKNLIIDGGAGSVASVIAGEFKTIGGVGFTGPGAGLTGVNAATMSGISVTAGDGLSGGGALSASRTISLGTPVTVSAVTANAVGPSSHTHALLVATQGTAEQGLDSTSLMTPLRVAQAVAAQALVAVAATGLGAVGSYAFMEKTGGANAPGTTAAGANLRFAAADSSLAGSAPAGTWRCMGRANGDGGTDSVTLWLRIS